MSLVLAMSHLYCNVHFVRDFGNLESSESDRRSWKPGSIEFVHS